MRLILHRVNTINDLLNTPPNYGVEVDIRTSDGNLILQHDPFVPGELFGEWLNYYHHRTLILNIKEEGLEEQLINQLHSRGINDYFFLDQSFPFLIKWSHRSKGRSAVRVSEFESTETALNLAGKVNWVWVDTFSYFPLTKSKIQSLKSAGFKLCLVSPELHDRSRVSEIHLLQNLHHAELVLFDAICTKVPDLWEPLATN